jgi:DNA uptake protein ComE-like DNA-binding protein
LSLSGDWAAPFVGINGEYRIIDRLEINVTRRFRLMNIAVIGLIVVLALAACDSASPASVESTPTPVSSAPATATPDTGSDVLDPAATQESAVASESTPTAETAIAGESTPTTESAVASESTPTTESAVDGESTATPDSATGGVAQAAGCVKLNLNDTTEEALMATIPNFSSRMVREFFEYRPYASIQQFRREIGKYVDDAQVAEYEKYVYVPVDPNNSDAATLMQLPGVDETVAAALIQARPYASTDAFLQSLAQQVSEQQLAEANCYLVTATNS